MNGQSAGLSPELKEQAEIVDAIRALLKQAQAGEVVSFIGSAVLKNGHIFNYHGGTLSNVFAAIGAATMLLDEVKGNFRMAMHAVAQQQAAAKAAPASRILQA